MPGIPLSAREATHSGTADQMCHPDARVHLSAEDELADEEGLSIYCKPVELYNILQRRAVRNPLFLQRCLQYKKEAKHCKRLQMKISLSGLSNQRFQIQALFPLHIMLAKRVPTINEIEYPAVFRFTSIRALTSSSTSEGSSVLASFVLPEINRLGKEAKSGLYFILFISYAESNSSCESNISKDSSESISYSSKSEKYCSWGRVPLESLFISLEKSLRLSLGERAEIILNLDLSPTLLKSGCFDNDNYISFQPPPGSADLRTLKQVQVIISAEELGAKEKSPYNSYTYSSIHESSLPSAHVLRLRSGNVVFNYRYNGNRSQRTEVTEDFICPFCLLGCASFKGLRYHLCSSHDLLNYEFWETDECQVVNVSVIASAWKFEMVGDADPQRQTIYLCKQPRIRRRGTSSRQSAKHGFPLAFASNMPAGVSELSDKADDAQSSKDDMARSLSVNGSQNVIADTGGLYAELGENVAPPVMLQFAKTRKISFERSEYRNRALLEKRQFFHSHRAQPMPLEQVLSDRDSEDEVDDDVADLEDRRMLEDFIDVTKDEKHMMHLWNSFVRKQRVLADSHIPWACEAFSKLHGPELTKLPAIGWCWRIFMIKLWNHGLLDARSMNNCNLILDQFVNQ